MATDKLLKDIEAAEMLSCSQSTFWRRVKDGTIKPPIRIGRMVRWRISDIQEFLDEADRARSAS